MPSILGSKIIEYSVFLKKHLQSQVLKLNLRLNRTRKIRRPAGSLGKIFLTDLSQPHVVKSSKYSLFK